MEEAELRRGERTRRAILDAARDLFLAKGYAATSMRQIAQAVHITPAAIYNHFAAKDEIFGTLLQEAAPIEELVAFLEGIADGEIEAVLLGMVRGLAQLFASHEEYIRLALIDAQERDGATLVAVLPRLYPSAMAFYARLADLDRRQGRLREIPPPLFMRALISLTFGYILTERVVKPAVTLGLPEMDWVQGLVDIFLHGVLRSVEGQ